MPGKVKILVADDVYLEPLKKLPRSKFQITVKQSISDNDIFREGCDVLVIRSTRKLDKNFLERFTGTVIATFTKGTDHIDIKSAKKKNIKILNSDKGNSQSAAEHTLLLILAASKNLIIADSIVRSGNFENLNYSRTELSGKKVGIIGYGSIGKRVGRLCKAFGMEILANDIDPMVKRKNKSINFKSLKYILKNCDIVSLHIPLNDKNIGFFSKEKLSLLKEDCIFINTSRGEVVDENCLLKLLKSRRIIAGLDVFSGEPNVNPLFFNHRNVILSNHIAGKTKESKRRISEDVTAKIIRFYM